MSSHLQFSDQLLGLHVGQKVKSLRRQYAITRRELAEKSNISERYIGQLENGQANVSLNVLNRIVVELGVSVADVLPGSRRKLDHEPLCRLLGSLGYEQLDQVFRFAAEKFGAPKSLGKGIALIGMRGAGKTSLGANLSSLSDTPFVQITGVIAEEAGMTLTQMVELSGLKGIRRLEREALEKIISTPGQIILETSGGIVSQAETYALLREHFTTIWIKADPEEHMQRVIDQNDLRPIAGRSSAMSDLKSLLAEREPGYRKADFVLNTTGRPERDCLGELAEISAPILSQRRAARDAAE